MIFIGHRAIYTLYEKGEASYFYSHWGANALTPLYRLSQALQWQEENKESISHVLEHLGDDGTYSNPQNPNQDMVFEKLALLEANRILNDFRKGSGLEMHIILDLDANVCTLFYNNNCPWYATMDSYEIPIDVGLKNMELLLEYVEKKGIDSFGKMEQLYNEATGIGLALQSARLQMQQEEREV